MYNMYMCEFQIWYAKHASQLLILLQVLQIKKLQ